MKFFAVLTIAVIALASINAVPICSNWRPSRNRWTVGVLLPNELVDTGPNGVVGDLIGNSGLLRGDILGETGPVNVEVNFLKNIGTNTADQLAVALNYLLPQNKGATGHVGENGFLGGDILGETGPVDVEVDLPKNIGTNKIDQLAVALNYFLPQNKGATGLVRENGFLGGDILGETGPVDVEVYLPKNIVPNTVDQLAFVLNSLLSQNKGATGLAGESGLLGRDILGKTGPVDVEVYLPKNIVTNTVDQLAVALNSLLPQNKGAAGHVAENGFLGGDILGETGPVDVEVDLPKNIGTNKIDQLAVALNYFLPQNKGATGLVRENGLLGGDILGETGPVDVEVYLPKNIVTNTVDQLAFVLNSLLSQNKGATGLAGESGLLGRDILGKTGPVDVEVYLPKNIVTNTVDQLAVALNSLLPQNKGAAGHVAENGFLGGDILGETGPVDVEVDLPKNIGTNKIDQLAVALNYFLPQNKGATGLVRENGLLGGDILGETGPVDVEVYLPKNIVTNTVDQLSFVLNSLLSQNKGATGLAGESGLLGRDILGKTGPVDVEVYLPKNIVRNTVDQLAVALNYLLPQNKGATGHVGENGFLGGDILGETGPVDVEVDLPKNIGTNKIDQLAVALNYFLPQNKGATGLVRENGLLGGDILGETGPVDVEVYLPKNIVTNTVDQLAFVLNSLLSQNKGATGLAGESGLLGRDILGKTGPVDVEVYLPKNIVTNTVDQLAVALNFLLSQNKGATVLVGENGLLGGDILGETGPVDVEVYLPKNIVTSTADQLAVALNFLLSQNKDATGLVGENGLLGGDILRETGPVDVEVDLPKNIGTNTADQLAVALNYLLHQNKGATGLVGENGLLVGDILGETGPVDAEVYLPKYIVTNIVDQLAVALNSLLSQNKGATGLAGETGLLGRDILGETGPVDVEAYLPKNIVTNTVDHLAVALNSLLSQNKGATGLVGENGLLGGDILGETGPVNVEVDLPKNIVRNTVDQLAVALNSLLPQNKGATGHVEENGLLGGDILGETGPVDVEVDLPKNIGTNKIDQLAVALNSFLPQNKGATGLVGENGLLGGDILGERGLVAGRQGPNRILNNNGILGSLVGNNGIVPGLLKSDVLGNVLQPILGNIVGNLNRLVGSCQGLLPGIFDQVSSIVSSLTSLGGLRSRCGGLNSDVNVNIVTNTVHQLAVALNFLLSQNVGATNIFGNLNIGPFLGVIQNVLGDLTNVVGSGVPNLLGNILGQLQQQIQILVSNAVQIVGNVTANVQATVEAALQQIGRLVCTLQDAFTLVINKVNDVVTTVARQVTLALTALNDTILQAVHYITVLVGSAIEEVTKVVSQVQNQLNQVLSGAINTLNRILNQAVRVINEVPSLVNGLAQSVTGIVRQVPNVLTGLTSGLNIAFSGVGDLVIPFTSNIRGLVLGITNTLGSLVSTTTGTVGSLIGGVNPLLKGLLGGLSGIGGGARLCGAGVGPVVPCPGTVTGGSVRPIVSPVVPCGCVRPIGCGAFNN